MQKLPDPKNTLTAGEAMERLKKNPNDPDPEIQEFKKVIDRFGESFMPSERQLTEMGSVVDRVMELYNRPFILESFVQAKDNVRRMMEFLNGHGIADVMTRLAEMPNIQPLLEIPTIDYVPISPEVETQRKLNQMNSNLERMISLLEKASEDKTTNIPVNALLSALPPENKKNKDMWKVAKALVANTNKRVSNYHLAKLIYTYIETQDDYKSKRKKYLKGLEYRIRTLRKFFEQFGYTISMKTSPNLDYSEIKNILFK